MAALPTDLGDERARSSENVRQRRARRTLRGSTPARTLHTLLLLVVVQRHDASAREGDQREACPRHRLRSALLREAAGGGARRSAQTHPSDDAPRRWRLRRGAPRTALRRAPRRHKRLRSVCLSLARNAAARRARARTVCRSRKFAASRADAASSACATPRSVARPVRSIAAGGQEQPKMKRGVSIRAAIIRICPSLARKERQQLA